MTGVTPPPGLSEELAARLAAAIRIYERRRKLRRRAHDEFATARKIGKARGHAEKLRRISAGDTTRTEETRK